ncbi:hypothetical protein KCU88_g328, partial [Aureobasidium melanogenum]
MIQLLVHFALHRRRAGPTTGPSWYPIRLPWLSPPFVLTRILRNQRGSTFAVAYSLSHSAGMSLATFRLTHLPVGAAAFRSRPL